MKSFKRKVKISSALYDAIEKMKYDRQGNPTGWESTQWIHLADAVECGSVSPLEAYDAVKSGYVPEHLRCRDSNYGHLTI